MNLLKLDRWKLFLLISPIPIVVLSIIVPATDTILEFLIIFSQIFLFTWYYQIGIQLQKNTDPQKIRQFKIAFLIVGSSFIIIHTIQFYHEYILHETPFERMQNASFLSTVLQIALGILVIFPSLIYMFYFNVKVLLSLKKPMWPYNGLQTTLLLLYASVFGFFILQPKINAYAESPEPRI
jgi:hypothetical protein